MTRASRRTGDARGFSIIELLFVVTILGILASIAVPRYNRYLIRADAVELGSRVTTIELGVREAEAMDGRLPRAGRVGVVPPELERFLPDSLFRAPIGVDLLYLMMDGRPYGVNHSIPGVLLTGKTARAREAIEAMATVYPRVATYGGGMAFFPFEGGTRRTVGGPAGGNPAGGSGSGSGTPQGPAPQQAAPQVAPAQPSQPAPSQPAPSQTAPSQVAPTPAGPSQSGTDTGGSTAGSGQGGYTPPPNACLMGGLPPGQQKRCASGGGNSAWFHEHGSGNGHRH